MMSKPKERLIYILPGAETWELWALTPTGEVESLPCPETTDISSLSSIPAGTKVLFFPTKTLIFAPFKVSTRESSLFKDLVLSHWEQMGMRFNEAEGSLTDFNVFEQEEGCLLAPYLLSAQQEGDLPATKLNHFDIAPHAYAVEGEALVFKKELGEWVFWLYKEGKCVYAQILGKELSAATFRDVSLTLLQLEQWGALGRKEAFRLEFWSVIEPALCAQIEELWEKKAEILLEKKPRLCTQWSALLPSDVGAQRRKAHKKRQYTIIGALVLLAYLVCLLVFYKNILTLEKEKERLTNTYQETEESFRTLEQVQAQWDSLSAVVDSALWPEDLLLRVFQARGEEKELRFQSFEVLPTEIEGQGAGLTLVIKGYASKPETITKFSQRLKNPQYKLQDYVWNTPNPTPGGKDKEEWSFQFEAQSVSAQPQAQ